MTVREIEYRCGDLVMIGFLADGSGGVAAPGVLVAHEAPGLGEHARQRASALAGEGYVALALDLYGAHDLPLDRARKESERVMATPGLMYQRANAALEALAGYPSVNAERLAAIGFCLGGIVALELARHGAPIKCAIGFHPGLLRPSGSLDGPISAKVLMMIGDRDPIVPPEDRASFAASMDAAGADWQLHVFGVVGHSYTNPAIDALGIEGFGYDAPADRRSWAMALALLDEQLCGGDAGIEARAGS